MLEPELEPELDPTLDRDEADAGAAVARGAVHSAAAVRAARDEAARIRPARRGERERSFTVKILPRGAGMGGVTWVYAQLFGAGLCVNRSKR